MSQPQGSGLPDCIRSTTSPRRHGPTVPPAGDVLTSVPKFTGLQPPQPPGWIGHLGSPPRTFALAVSPA